MASNKLAVITGGASGLGEATARRFLADGYDIALLDVNTSREATPAHGLG